MDNNNLTPSFPKGEPAMDTCDWRAQLPSDSREKIIGKIMETIRKQLPYSGPEEIKELRRIASKFEEKIFGCAANQLDYLGKISIKMLTMEITKWQSAAGSSSLPFPLPIPGVYNSLSLYPGISPSCM
ncbi:mediator of RNA polymerase II transcription subunit 15a-like [Brassica napus]|uniref:mediator of RNA polymerase II transcription subunit 15a-like n=1 Tax=Brassica napus TaxID=3708 RepID=UPI0020797D9C|nr:mediator of RNA polymerase II transcription subunit 15a-like [Brassica napus]